MASTVNPRQNVTFPSNGGVAHGYLAVPDGGSGPGVVVIQEWWGLTSHISGVVDRLAADGFVALAPDLFGGATTHDSEEAAQLMARLPVERATKDLTGAVDYLLALDSVTGDQIGLVGFCIGGAFVLSMAVQEGGKVAAAVPFYPVGPLPHDYAGLQAAVLAHFGEQDAFVPISVADELADDITAGNGQKPDIVRYPAGHAFFNDDNLLGTHDPEQAAKAWELTIGFLREHLS
jgi:carboxymethylenebutenolidase